MRCILSFRKHRSTDFSVLQFRLDFMRVFRWYPMKSHKNQRLVMPLHAPQVPYRALTSPQAILYEGYKPSYGQYVTDFSVPWFFAVNTRVSAWYLMKSIIFQRVVNEPFQEVGRPEGDIRDFVPRSTWFETQGEPYMELLAHRTVFEVIDLNAISWGIPRRPA